MLDIPLVVFQWNSSYLYIWHWIFLDLIPELTSSSTHEKQNTGDSETFHESTSHFYHELEVSTMLPVPVEMPGYMGLNPGQGAASQLPSTREDNRNVIVPANEDGFRMTRYYANVGTEADVGMREVVHMYENDETWARTTLESFANNEILGTRNQHSFILIEVQLIHLNRSCWLK